MNETTLDIDKIRIKAHYDGIRIGVRLYAWWKDGIQYVGSCGRTLQEALTEIDYDEIEALRAAEEKTNA